MPNQMQTPICFLSARQYTQSRLLQSKKNDPTLTKKRIGLKILHKLEKIAAEKRILKKRTFRNNYIQRKEKLNLTSVKLSKPFLRGCTKTGL